MQSTTFKNKKTGNKFNCSRLYLIYLSWNYLLNKFSSVNLPIAW